MKVSTLLANPDNWAQRFFAGHRTASGSIIDALDSYHNPPENANCWCLVGAVHHCYPSQSSQNLVKTKLKAVLKQWADIGRVSEECILQIEGEPTPLLTIFNDNYPHSEVHALALAAEV